VSEISSFDRWENWAKESGHSIRGFGAQGKVIRVVPFGIKLKALEIEVQIESDNQPLMLRLLILKCLASGPKTLDVIAEELAMQAVNLRREIRAITTLHLAIIEHGLLKITPDGIRFIRDQDSDVQTKNLFALYGDDGEVTIIDRPTAYERVPGRSAIALPEYVAVDESRAREGIELECERLGILLASARHKVTTIDLMGSGYLIRTKSNRLIWKFLVKLPPSRSSGGNKLAQANVARTILRRKNPDFSTEERKAASMEALRTAAALATTPPSANGDTAYPVNDSPRGRIVELDSLESWYEISKLFLQNVSSIEITVDRKTLTDLSRSRLKPSDLPASSLIQKLIGSGGITMGSNILSESGVMLSESNGDLDGICKISTPNEVLLTDASAAEALLRDSSLANFEIRSLRYAEDAAH